MYNILNVSSDFINNKSILITGGTGSFGKQMLKTLLTNFNPKRIVIFSRDEFKQSEMQKEYDDKKCINRLIFDEILSTFLINSNIKKKFKRKKKLPKKIKFALTNSMEKQIGFKEAQSGAFFRKGTKNQWKDNLSVKQINKLENKFRDFMNKFGYD